MTKSKSPKRYHPALVTLHWLIMLLVFGTLFMLGGAEEGEGGASAGVAQSINMHMIVGVVVLLLMAIRLLVRWRTERPEWATTGNAFLNKIGEWTHYALYFFTFAITVTGIALAAQTNQLAGLFGGGGGRVEGEGIRFGLGAFHGLSWSLLALLIFLHTAGALYHQFIVKDNLFARMWFGNQSE
jgi:cytochrome b561